MSFSKKLSWRLLRSAPDRMPPCRPGHDGLQLVAAVPLGALHETLPSPTVLYGHGWAGAAGHALPKGPESRSSTSWNLLRPVYRMLFTRNCHRRSLCSSSSSCVNNTACALTRPTEELHAQQHLVAKGRGSWTRVPCASQAL